MAADYLAVLGAFQEAHNRCECTDPQHADHDGGRCGRLLLWEQRGRDREFGWEALEREDRIVILCRECHASTTGDNVPPVHRTSTGSY